MKFIPPILLLLLVTANAQGEGKVKFNRDIRPIMSDTCFHCHGPDKSSRKGACGWISVKRRSSRGKAEPFPSCLASRTRVKSSSESSPLIMTTSCRQRRLTRS